MPGFDSVVDRFLNTPDMQTAPVPVQKQVSVAQAAATKINNMNQPLDREAIAASRLAGENAGADSAENELEYDRLTMNGMQLLRKYGDAGLGLMEDSVYGTNSYVNNNNMGRSGWQAVDDTVNDAATGFVNAVGSIGALAAGAVNADAGNYIAGKLDDFTQWSQDQQSYGLRARREAYEARMGAKRRDSTKAYNDDLASGKSKFWAGAARIGRDALNAGVETLDDGMLTTSIAANGTGSLFAGGPISKGLGVVGRGILRAGMAADVVGFGGARAALSFGSKAAMPASIGLMEGGGAYQQAVMDAQMELAGRDDLTQEEKNEIANRASLIAAGIQAPIGAATGLLTSKFEAHPTRVGSVREGLQNLGKETLEEGVQSMSAQQANNLGVRWSGANENRDISEGVGEQLALGAIGGFGAAGMAQAPGMAVRGTVAAAKGAGRAIVGGADLALARGERIRAENAENSPVSDTNMATAVDRMVQDAPNIEERVRSAVLETATPEQRAQVDNALGKIYSAATYNHEPVAATYSAIAPELEGATNKFEALKRARDIAGDDKRTPAERLEAGALLLDLSDSNAKLFEQDLPEAIAGLDDNHEAKKTLAGYQNMIQTLGDNPRVMEAVNMAASLVNDETLSNPETAQNAASVAAESVVRNPEALTGDQIDLVLKHQETNPSLTPNQVRGLQAAKGLAQAAMEMQAKAKAMGINNIASVGRQVLSDQNGPDEAKQSMAQHLKGIIAAVNAGNDDLAASRLRSFALFAEHMQNKVGALNTALETGKTNDRNTVKYRALLPAADGKPRRWGNDPKGVYVDPTKKGSIELAQKVALEAGQLGAVANRLVETYPEIADLAGIEHLTLAELHPSLTEDSRSVVKEYAGKPAPVPENETSSQENETDSSEQNSAEVTAPKAKKKAVDDRQGELDLQPPVKAEEKVVTPAEEKVPTDAEVIETQKELNADKAARRREETERLATEEQNEADRKAAALENPKTITDAFPDLLGSEDTSDTTKGKIRNWFRRTFKLGTKDGKPITHYGFADALVHVRDALSSGKALADVMGRTTGHRLTANLVNAYDEYLGTYGAGMAEALENSLQNSKPELLKRLREGVEANRYKNGLSLNLTEMDEDGNVRWNPHIMNTSILAALNWVLNSSTQGTPQDVDRLARQLGINPDHLSDQDVLDFNSTVSTDEVRDRLASILPKYWGVSPDNTAYKSVVDGIANAMAGEVMKAMKQVGLIDFWEKGGPDRREDDPALRIVITDNFGKTLRTYTRVNSMGRSDETKALLGRLRAFPSAIEHASIVAAEYTTFVGKAPEMKDISPTQERSPVKITGKQRRMVNRANNTVYRANLPLINLAKALRVDGFLDLVGESELKGRKLNKNHRASLEGRNTNLRGAFEMMEALWEEATNKGLEAGIKPEDMDVFFKHGIIKNGRLMQIGRYTPQTNKLLREMFLSTMATLDMTTKGHEDNYMLAMAQALGIKVNKEGKQASIEQVKAKLNTTYAPVVDMLSKWQQGDQKVFTEDQVELIKDAIEADTNGEAFRPSMVALHALMDYARLQNMDEAGRKKFDTKLYLEADGVSNGPAMAMMMFTHSPFTREGNENLRRTGFFPGQRGKLSYAEGNTDAEGKPLPDLYGYTGTNMQDRMVNDNQDLDLTKPEGIIASSVMRMASSWLSDFSVTDKGDGSFDVTIKRGLMKNPLTITVYGSGMEGIASKIAREIVQNVYEFQSRILEGANEQQQGIWEDILAELEYLMSNRMVENKDALDGSMIHEEGKGQTIHDKDGSVTFSGTQMDFLTSNISQHIVGPMVAAVENTMRLHSTSALPTIQKVVQIQSMYAMNAWNADVQERMAWHEANDPNWQKGDFLSQAELDEISRKNGIVNPYVETGDQNFLMSGSAKGVATDSTGNKRERLEFGASLSGSLAGPALIWQPGDAGVKGMPYMTIGPGDGQTILNMFEDNPSLDNVTPIFDGVHMPLDKIDEYGELINKAAMDAALGNPARDVLESFRAFVRDGAVIRGKMSEKELKWFTGAVLRGIPKSEMISTIDEALDYYVRLLEQQANGIDARHEAMREVGINVDQMAAAEAPYSTHKAEDDWNDDKAFEALEKSYNEKMNVASSESVSVGPLRQMGVQDPSGVRVLNPAQVGAAIDTMNIPAQHKSLIKSALSALGSKAPNLVIGDAKQLAAYGAKNGLAAAEFDNSTFGLFHMASNTIYMQYTNSETLAHELVHAATLRTVVDHYNDPSNSLKSTAEAIARLERLMAEWKATREDKKRFTPAAARAFDNMDAELARAASNSGYTEAMRKAAELNEFMAWTLANQTLAASAKRTPVMDKLARIARSAFQWIRGLVFKNAAPELGNDMLSNIRFNTEILMRDSNTRQTIFGTMNDLTTYHREMNPNAPETKVREALTKKVSAFIDNAADVIEVSERVEALTKAAEIGDSIVEALAKQGFNYSPDKQALLGNLVAVFASGMQIDGNMANRLDQIYRHVTSKLSSEMLSRDQSDPSANAKADLMLGAILGENIVKTDNLGRSTLLPTFLGLAMIDEDMKRALKEIDLPSSTLPGYGNADDALSSYGTRAMDKLGRWLSGENIKATNAGDAIASLMGTFANNTVKEAGFLSMAAQKGGDLINKFNGWVVNQQQALSGKAVDKLAEKIGDSDSKAARMTMGVGLALASAVNEDIAETATEDLMKAADRNSKISWEARSLMNEVFGRNSFNAPIFDMIKQVKAVVSKGRETYRERLPLKIAAQFTRPLTDAEWSHLYNGMGKTDLAAMLSGRTQLSDVLDVLSDFRKVDALVKDHEDAIRGLTKASPEIFAKAKQLANYMQTGEYGHQLLRNAEAIAFFNRATDEAEQENLKNAIDRLTTLYALQALSGEQKAALTSLVQEQREGMEFATAYMHRLRTDELSKAGQAGDRSGLNSYKGHIPSEQAENTSMLVAEDEQYASLTEQGYQRVADYVGSIHEVGGTKKGYYFKAMSAKPIFNQGLAQTVRQTAGGVDPVTGYTFGKMTAGVISDPRLVARIQRSYESGSASTENLMPVFNAAGRVVAYERGVDPAQEARLDRSTDLAKMIGAWKGRQYEEMTALEFNRQMAINTHTMWEENRGTKQEDGFINLFSDEALADPVIKDAVDLFPDDLRKEIESLYGKDGFMVPRSLVQDIIGQRSASVSDFWSGNSRWSKETQRNMQNFLTAAFGIDAYKKAVTAERMYQSFIHDAKKNIIIRSVIVPVANLASNFVQAMGRGISPVTLVRELPKKTAEIDAYVANHLQHVSLEADLEAAKGRKDTIKARQIEVQMKTLEDAQRRMSIWPLIEAGEFSSISEGLENEGGDWKSLTKGKLSDYIESKVNQLPKAARTLGRYGYLTQDTALFRGLQKSVDYGDFIFKAVLYDHLRKQKKTHAEAIGAITEEFVHYDRMTGRWRQGLEGMGLIWFWRFKLRSVKTAANMIRNNPVHALLANMMPVPMASGGPITDNIVGSLISGNLGYSIGPGQALRGYTMNPWISLAGL